MSFIEIVLKKMKIFLHFETFHNIDETMSKRYIQNMEDNTLE